MGRKNRAENWSFNTAGQQNLPDQGSWGGRACSSEGIYCSDKPVLSCIVMPVLGPGHSSNHGPEAESHGWGVVINRNNYEAGLPSALLYLSKEQTLAIQIILAFKITWTVTLQKILAIYFNQQRYLQSPVQEMHKCFIIPVWPTKTKCIYIYIIRYVST